MNEDGASKKKNEKFNKKPRHRGGRRGSNRKSNGNRPPLAAGDVTDNFISYYKQQLIPESLSEEEFNTMVKVLKSSLPHVFRISTLTHDLSKTQQEFEHQCDLLRANNFEAAQLDCVDNRFGPIYKLNVDRPKLNKSKELAGIHAWLNAHANSGDITRQEFVSMLPPFFLDVQPNDSVLDCCASPGSKTSEIMESLKNGLIVANDNDPKRLQTLIHQINRNVPFQAIVICEDARYIPDITKFDKVLCDVPCSGDGTFRKNRDASSKWNTKNGCILHSTQREILIRGLQLLKVGGKCVYSTCSLNPIENEAVINSVINDLDGAVSIADCSSLFPKLNRSPGLKNWVVKNFKDDPYYKSYDEVPEEKRKYIPTTMFPFPVVDGIENCMRFYPQQNDCGGFFVTVLEKKSEFEFEITPPKTPPSQWREKPFLPLKSISTGQQIIDKIKEDYGVDDDFPFDNLFARAEDVINKIYYLSDAAAEVVKNNPPEKLHAASCGVATLAWKKLTEENAVNAFPSYDGINLMYTKATKRKVTVSPADLKLLLVAGNPGTELQFLCEETQAALQNEVVGGIIVYIKDTDFIYAAIKMKKRLGLQLKKEAIKHEIYRLESQFPEVKEIGGNIEPENEKDDNPDNEQDEV